ncbi:MAG: magnesium transporter [Burkholderiaceae bacterium]
MSDPVLQRPDDTLAKKADERPWETVTQWLDQNELDQVAKLLDAMPPSEAARTLTHLSEEDRHRVLSSVPAQIAADLIEEFPIEFGAELVDSLSSERAADVLNQITSDTRADLIAESIHAEEIFAEMDPKAAADLRELASYEPDTAGGLMVADSLTISEEQTVGRLLLRLAGEDGDDDRYLGQSPYMVDGNNRVVGYASLASLLKASRSAKLKEVMSPAMTVPADRDLDKLLDLFDKHDFLSIPVCDDDGHILGIVSQHNVDVAAFERAESDSYKRSGVVGDELRSMPLWLRSRRRLAWLTGNIGLNILAASVIASYEATLAAVITIAVFLPMVSDMSGCSGNQAVAVSLRELALGLIKPVDAFRVWLKEVSVGLINGCVLGIVLGIVCWAWKGNPYLGLVIGLALAINTVLSVSIGGVIPLLLKKFNQDPAVASGPLLTTVTDMAGFFFVLSLATAFMPLLQQ